MTDSKTPETPKRNKPARERRSIKLILPDLQLRLICWFTAMTSIALVGQFLLFSSSLTRFAAQMPEGGPYLTSSMGELLFDVLIFSFGMLLPATLLIGIHATFRVAGPIYRFKEHLKKVAAGEFVGPCRIRSGDQLQDLCQLINDGIDRARRDGPQVLHPSSHETAAPAEEKQAA